MVLISQRNGGCDQPNISTTHCVIRLMYGAISNIKCFILYQISNALYYLPSECKKQIYMKQISNILLSIMCISLSYLLYLNNRHDYFSI